MTVWNCYYDFNNMVDSYIVFVIMSVESWGGFFDHVDGYMFFMG